MPDSKPAPRVLWKGAISFGLVHVPVALYPASQETGIDFDWLERWGVVGEFSGTHLRSSTPARSAFTGFTWPAKLFWAAVPDPTRARPGPRPTPHATGPTAPAVRAVWRCERVLRHPAGAAVHLLRAGA